MQRHLRNKMFSKLRHNAELAIGTDTGKEDTYQKDVKPCLCMMYEYISSAGEKLHLQPPGPGEPGASAICIFILIFPLLLHPSQINGSSSCSPCGLPKETEWLDPPTPLSYLSHSYFLVGNEHMNSMVAVNWADWYLNQWYQSLGWWQIRCWLVRLRNPSVGPVGLLWHFSIVVKVFLNLFQIMTYIHYFYCLETEF